MSEVNRVEHAADASTSDRKGSVSSYESRFKTMSAPPDIAIVERVLVELKRKNGTAAKENYRVLVERYQTRALAVAFEILRSREDAEDVVQEAFVKAYLSLADFMGASSFYTWFYRIVYNMAIDYRRKLQRRGGATHELDEAALSKNNAHSGVMGAVEGPHDALLRTEQRTKINEALSNISEEHRAVIMLREVEGMSYDQIAETVGISKGTVMSRLHYARRRLQVALAELVPELSSRAFRGPEADEDEEKETVVLGIRS